MIEFALLFGLGFLTAAFLVFLIAPAIHRRIVSYTEKRLKATMPLSPQEVRAQKDMARALYAAENAKTEQALAREREKAISLQLRQDDLLQKAGKLATEIGEMHAQINEMNSEAGDLRSRLRREESYISQMKATLRISEHANAEKDSDLDTLRKRLHKVTSDADGLKIDLATRDAEIESAKFRSNALRDERETLRQELNLVTKRARDAELRLAQEESRAQRLEEKLGREIAGNADKDTALDRRLQEITRLKDKLKAANAEAREAGRALRAAGRPAFVSRTNGTHTRAAIATKHQANDKDASIMAAGKPERDVDADIAHMTDDVRNRSKALSDRLLKARTPAHDKAMRDELATIAANMVALTALKEGETSPIHDLLPQEADGDHSGERSRVSLADRARTLLSDS